MDSQLISPDVTDNVNQEEVSLSGSGSEFPSDDVTGGYRERSNDGGFP